jgi:tRNA threonylcarbamoyladenosine biosynthesis protein TsaE
LPNDSVAGVILLEDAQATERLGGALAAQLRAGDAVALFGTLGAGKTTLARGVLRGLGFGGDVASPTFPIVQVYDTAPPLWHVDLYRIDHDDELAELGLDDARHDAALLIEWPERLPRLWADTLRLSLAIRPDGVRALTAEVPPAWGGRWPPP